MVARAFREDVRALLLQRLPVPAVRSPEIRLNVRSRSTRSSRTNRRPTGSENERYAYRSLLQSNYIFSLIVLAYNLGAQLDPPFAVPFSDRDLLNDSARKTLGDAFEALVGGLEIDGQSETFHTLARRSLFHPILWPASLKSEQVFRVRLETTHGGKSLTAFSTTKKVAENGAARLAPLDLRSDAAASLTHFCGLGS
ncbi:hypothetical protein B0A53_00530 [Rhodotorula sp. CCFEE 5036]|nr:hypothetical protein B0A53_00530 [Rhodotorula sp. CCFEE 5036]